MGEKAAAKQTVGERSAFLREAMASGQDPVAAISAAAGGSSLPPKPVPEPPPPPADEPPPLAAERDPGADPVPKPPEGEGDELAPTDAHGEAFQRLAEAFGQQGSRATRPGDPAGTYRDEFGQLRRQDNDARLEEPARDDGAGEGAGDPVAGGEAEAAGGTEPDPLAPILLPGRQDGETYEFKPRTAEEAERLRQLANGYRRGRRIETDRAELEGIRSELDSRVRRIRHDPTGFFSDELEEADQARVVRDLLLRLPAKEFEALVTELSEWEDSPTARESAALLAENARLKNRDDFDRSERDRLADQRHVRSVIDAVTELVPETMDEARASEFYDFALFKLENHVRSNRGARVDPAGVPALLDELGALAPFGLSANGSPPATTSREASAATTAQRNGAVATAAEVERAREVGPEFQRRTAARRDATRLAPAGAGASPMAGFNPPPGQGVKDRLTWAKRLLKR